MKIAALLLLTALPLAAQTSRTPSHASHSTAAGGGAHTAAGRSGCVETPQLSPKIPALPAGLACPHALYTITTVPSVKLDYVSPLAGEGLRETLGLAPSTFSLAYVDTKIGSGPLAAPHKWYTIHYTGYLVDGTKFDSSLDRKEPIVVHIGDRQVIPGWDTGFGGMHVGGKRRLFIPYQLAYGTSGRAPIPAKAELVFDVELIAQSDNEPKPAPAEEAKPAAKDAPDATTDTAKPASPQPGATPSSNAPASTPPPTASKPQ